MAAVWARDGIAPRRRIWDVMLVKALIAAATAATLAVAGCGGRDDTSLTIEARNSFLGTASFALRCDPPSGDLPDPPRACATIERRPRLVLEPQSFTCAGGTFSWWDVRIRGRLEGDAVDVETSTCWTEQMPLIAALGIGSETLQRHIDPGSRPAYPGAGIPLSSLADVVDVPDSAPGWLVRIARLEARALGDPRPDELRISLGEQHVVALRGEFVCGSCSYPHGAEPPRGSVARIVVDPGTRIVSDFSLGR